MEKQILADLLDEQINGFIVLDHNKQMIYANKKVKALFGYEGQGLTDDFILLQQQDAYDTITIKNWDINQAIDQVMATKETTIARDIEIEYNGEITILSIKVAAINEWITLEIFNIGQSYEELAFLSSLVEKSSEIMIFKDRHLRYRYINKSGESFFGTPKEAILNKVDEDLLGEELLNQCKRGDLITLEEGRYSEIETMGDRIFRVSKEYINEGILCIAKDITDEIKANRRAEIDSLTGLYNRRKFMYMIDEIYKSQESNYYLALIDLDDLRTLNNQYGHLKGDEYLKKIGEILTSHSDGLFFRLGGDEFAALIYKEKEQVETIFNNIFNELEDLNYEPKLSISVGIKKIDINHSYLYNYEQVDKLLYQVKEKGKNAFCIM